MTPADLSRLSTLIDEALELPLPERELWLAALQGEAATWAPTLRKLLARNASKETNDLLDHGPSFTMPVEHDRSPTFQPGGTVGPYRLQRPIGRGGMGEVWLAERSDGHLKRTVALKLPALDIRRSVLVQRFARERDILASLAHPHIARLYDAGLAIDGQPYLALEYVDGQPITEYCADNHLDLRERVQLLRQVMDAVQHAHANLVIHRDLKPSNVLVTNQGQAMLLDFGIAKLLQEDVAEAQETELTRVGGRAMTLDYAAPEQISGAPVSIATDVYALGVLAYELLAGQRPFKGTRVEVEQGILNTEAQRPKLLPPDLATIVLKALKKPPVDRYATVAAFAEDLDRWRSGEPVRAQADSAWYRGRKFIGRHRAAVATAATVLATVVGASGISLWQARQARQEARRALAVQGFLLDLFRTNTADQADPARARQTTARELLDRGAARLGSSLLGEPASRMILTETLGELYAELQLWPEASRLSAEQIVLARQIYGGDDRHLATALVAHARALDQRERDSATEVMPLLTEAERILDVAGDRASVLRGHLHLVLAAHLSSRSTAEAQRHAERAVIIFRDHHPDDPGHEDALEMLANSQFRQGDRAAAAETIAHAVSQARAKRRSEFRLGPLLRRAGEVQVFAGDFKAAEPSLREALAIAERLYGEHGAATVTTRLILARHLAWSGRLADARALADQALADAAAPAGEHEPFQLQATRRIVFEVYWAHGDLAACRRLIAQAFIDFGPGAPDSFEHADLLLDRAMVETADGDLVRSRATLAAAGAMAGRLGMGSRSLLGRYIVIQDAEQRLAAGDAEGALAKINVLAADAAASGISAVVNVRVQALAAVGHVGEARGMLDAALRELESASDRVWRADAEADLQYLSGRLSLDAGDCRAALPALERSVELFQRIHVPRSPQRAQAEAARRTCLARLAALAAAPGKSGAGAPR